MTGPVGFRPVPSPAEVESQLADIWREASTDGQAVMRACALNLVVICADAEDELVHTTGLIARIAATAPGRALVVGPPGGKRAELDVYVSAHCHRDANGAQVCSEQITIEPGGSSLDLVPGTVLQLLVEEMPVYTWWRRHELDPHPWVDRLVELSDYWILDSATSGAPGAHLKALHAFASRRSWNGHVIDAAWARQATWREALASFFDDALLRPALDRITRLRVSGGGRVACAYLAAWLVSRLGFVQDSRRRWLRPDGAPVALELVIDENGSAESITSARIEADLAGSPIRFDAGLAGERNEQISLTAGATGYTVPERRLRLPSLDEAALICGMLQRTGCDPVFEAALTVATRIV